MVDEVAARFASSPALQRDGLVAADDCRREAARLIADLARQPRGWVATASAAELEPGLVDRVRASAERRARGEPLAYVTGLAGFRALELAVDPRVLIPRPETEQLVELALARTPEGGIVVDIGTGSGAIALSLAAEGAARTVIGTDLSVDALAVAEANGERLAPRARERLVWRQGSLLAPLVGERGTIDVLVSNPPYIAEDELRALPASVRDWEPPVALVSGRDGMTAAWELIDRAPAFLSEGGWMLLELDTRRLALAARRARDAGGYDSVEVVRDLFGRDRFLVARRRRGSL
ncbi:MAG: peptide chain release factor N(5)-glutamine methyltransferase [Gemmatimonadaceae bacterium]|nr:peptide chain release factor N(5)-glutamine methyltransferase [Gemmatimonadaceae bacterium]